MVRKLRDHRLVFKYLPQVTGLKMNVGEIVIDEYKHTSVFKEPCSIL